MACSTEHFGVLLRQVGAEIPIDSDDADEAQLNDNGRTLLYVFSRGCSIHFTCSAQSLLVHQLYPCNKWLRRSKLWMDKLVLTQA